MQFLMRQGIAVGCNLLYGLLCVRMLPVADYAKFAVLFGYMGSLTVLLDVGISGTLVPLVGEQIANLQLIANYVASIRRIALWMYLIVAPIACIVFIALVQKQNWGTLVIVQMLAALLVTAWFARVSSSYGAVLILRRDRSRYYRVQILGSAGSLALLVSLWALHRMNIYVAILLNVAQIMFNASNYYLRSRELLRVKGRYSAQQEKAIVRLAVPNAPGNIFFAIQGQVTLMLITLFGHTSASVASVGALSRLSQILIFFAQMYPILVEPFFAKLQATRVIRVFLAGVIILSAFATAYTALAFYYPEVFLWVLGPKYSKLRFEVSLQIMSSAISFVSSYFWIVNSSRRFVYWWNSIANIILILLVQGVFIWKLDLSQVKNVLILNVATATATLIVYASGSVYGFLRGPQKMEHIEHVEA